MELAVSESINKIINFAMLSSINVSPQSINYQVSKAKIKYFLDYLINSPFSLALLHGALFSSPIANAGTSKSSMSS